MRYPNRRYGDPAALAYYTQAMPDKERVRLLARQLRRSERSVREWLTGARKMPWWVPEIVRLQQMEHADMLRQMNVRPIARQLGVVDGAVIAFPRPAAPPPEPEQDAVPVLPGRRMAIC